MAPARAHIQNRIRALRFHHGEMTQRELALRIGVTRQTVNAIEGSKYSPSLEVAFRIAEVFGVPLGEVFQHVVPGRPGAPDEPGDAGGEARRGP